MIIRILGEGQFEIADDHIDDLNELDAAVEKSVEGDNEDAFRVALTALLDAVRREGTKVPDEDLESSDLALPPSDATLVEVREMLSDDGLIPG